LVTHRAQASTVDVAHRYEDGGGRSLAYVSMSRARQRNTVHVVADDLDQAVEHLTRDWAVHRRARWAIDTGTPARQPLDAERDTAAPAGLREALRLARLKAHRQAAEAAIPLDRTQELRAADIRLAARRRARQDLEVGQGRYADTAEGKAARDLNTARSRRRKAERFADTADGGRTRRHWRKDADDWARREAKARIAYDEIVMPEGLRLDREIDSLNGIVDELRTHQSRRDAWLRAHPEAASRRQALDRELDPLGETPQIHQELSRLLAPRHELQLRPEHGRDLGIDIGL
jgi:hypothetical protein